MSAGRRVNRAGGKNPMDQYREQTERKSAWKSAQYVCALSDDARHLGHIIRLEKWHAYDATQLNEQQNGFKQVGSFEWVGDAKRAVELSIAASRPRSLAATAGHPYLI
jgi:hypothetical protein